MPAGSETLNFLWAVVARAAAALVAGGCPPRPATPLPSRLPAQLGLELALSVPVPRGHGRQCLPPAPDGPLSRDPTPGSPRGWGRSRATCSSSSFSSAPGSSPSAGASIPGSSGSVPSRRSAVGLVSHVAGRPTPTAGGTSSAWAPARSWPPAASCSRRSRCFGVERRGAAYLGPQARGRGPVPRLRSPEPLRAPRVHLLVRERNDPRPGPGLHLRRLRGPAPHGSGHGYLPARGRAERGRARGRRRPSTSPTTTP